MLEDSVSVLVLIKYVAIFEVQRCGLHKKVPRWILSYLKWAAGLWISLNQLCLDWRLVNEKVPVMKKLVEGSRPTMRQPGHIIS